MMTWQAWAFLSAGFAALTAILAKVGVEDVHPDLATFVRTCVVAVTLGVILAITGAYSRMGAVTARSCAFLTLSGLATGASWVCYFRALKIGNASLVAPIDKLSVVLVAILGVLFLGERLSPRNWLGIAMIAVGAILVAGRR